MARAGALLRSGSLTDFQALGAVGTPVYSTAEQLLAAMRRQLGQDVAELFAIPKPNESGDAIDWYAPTPGDVVPWSAASPEERRDAKAALLAARERLLERSRALQADDDRERQVFGKLLEQATNIPSDEHVYLVNGSPVVSFWGFRNRGAPDGLDVLGNLETGSTLVPAASSPEPAPTPTEAPAASAERRRPWYYWWLWLLPLLLLLGLLWLGLRSCTQEAPPPPAEPKPSETPPERGEDRIPPEEPGRVIERRAVDAIHGAERVIEGSDSAVGGTITETETHEGTPGLDAQTPAAAEDVTGVAGTEPEVGEPPPPAAPTEPGLEPETPATEPGSEPETPATEPEPEEPAAETTPEGQEKDEPPDAAPEETPPETPAAEAPEAPGAEPGEQGVPPLPDPGAAPKTTDAVPPGKPEPGPPLTIPPEALKGGSTSFLTGQWRSVSGLQDTDGNPVQLEYDFKDGKGTATLHRGAGPSEQRCTGAVKSVMRDGKLVIEETGSITCPDGTLFRRSNVECSVGEGGRAKCRGINEDGTSYNVSISGK